MRRFCLIAVLVIGAHFLDASVFAQTPSPVQSTARPNGLSIVGPVDLAGSDAASAAFQATTLPSVLQVINAVPDQRMTASPNFAWLDPAQLHLTTATDVRVYFIGESTGFHNTLGFNTSGSGITSGNPKLIFPDASTNALLKGTTPGGKSRTANDPLMPGDFVNLGKLAAGTDLDFFLISDGARHGKYTFSTDRAANPDGVSHVLTLALKDSPYLILGFEDQFGGGDRKFNDLFIAVDIGVANVRALTSAPAPATWMALGSFLVIGAIARRRVHKRHKCCSNFAVKS